MKYPRWWNETITIFHKERKEGADKKTQTTWQREFTENCFWGNTQKQIFSDKSLIMQDALIVRIPVGKSKPLNKGDIVVLGEITDAIENSGSELLNKYKGTAFVINTAKDNSKLKNAHYYGSDV